MDHFIGTDSKRPPQTARASYLSHVCVLVVVVLQGNWRTLPTVGSFLEVNTNVCHRVLRSEVLAAQAEADACVNLMDER